MKMKFTPSPITPIPSLFPFPMIFLPAYVCSEAAVSLFMMVKLSLPIAINVVKLIIFGPINNNYPMTTE